MKKFTDSRVEVDIAEFGCIEFRIQGDLVSRIHGTVLKRNVYTQREN